MFYNVVVTEDEYEDPYYSQLVFSFNSLDEALKFTEIILQTSDYIVKILKIEDKGEQ